MMFRTIKSRIVFLAVMVWLFLSLLLFFSTYTNYQNSKNLMLMAGDFAISTFAEKIEQETSKLEDNVLDLALAGQFYLQYSKTNQTADFVVKQIFENYENSLGGGIWFKPFAADKTQKRMAFYAYRNEDDEVVLDPDFVSESYNYLERSWYLEIMPQLENGAKLAWSDPYYEDQGSEKLMTTIGAGIYENNRLVGLATVDWEIGKIVQSLSEMQPTPNSFALFADKQNDFVISTTDKYLENEDVLGVPLDEIPWYKNINQENSEFEYEGTTYVSYTKDLGNGLLLIVNVPKNELFNDIIKMSVQAVFFRFLAVLFVVFVLFFILERNVNRPIKILTKTAEEIGQGHLDIDLKIKDPKEFADLATSVTQMTKDIQNYIKNLNNVTKEKERMESELSIAQVIQRSALPNYFYPEKKEFSLFAKMQTAREVGGDFYDFFYINPKKFMFLIADVSGKGIPAALFMMTTKTMIKNLASECDSLEEVLTRTNQQIAENNEQNFFITLFAGVVDVETGEITFVNCGHNYPLIYRAKTGVFEYYQSPANMVLGAFDDFKYLPTHQKLEQGDMIFLYTDGVTEALNKKKELYGEGRLKNRLNKISDKDVHQILEKIFADVKKFAGSQEQSDDITMLALKFNGKNSDILKEELTVKADINNFGKVQSWGQNVCRKFGASEACLSKVDLAAEELFVNVASYAYPGKKGSCKIVIEKCEDMIRLCFIDGGTKYNPLLKPDPDVSLSADERDIGGLGIYLVKQMADNINYTYKDKENIMTIEFKL